MSYQDGDVVKIVRYGHELVIELSECSDRIHHLPPAQGGRHLCRRWRKCKILRKPKEIKTLHIMNVYKCRIKSLSKVEELVYRTETLE